MNTHGVKYVVRLFSILNKPIFKIKHGEFIQPFFFLLYSRVLLLQLKIHKLHNMYNMIGIAGKLQCDNIHKQMEYLFCSNRDISFFSNRGHRN